MRLLTHNQLVCVKPDCVNSFPLKLVPEAVEQEETEFNADFVVNIMPRVDYAVLHAVATTDLGIDTLPAVDAMPDTNTLTVATHGELLKALHTVLVDTHVVAGALVCNECAREYKIVDRIPNMRLNEEEVPAPSSVRH
jgi:multifunctional methyltransferase subunit TRM112